MMFSMNDFKIITTTSMELTVAFIYFFWLYIFVLGNDKVVLINQNQFFFHTTVYYK